MIALAPVTLTGANQTVSLLTGAPQGQPWPIRIANESTYALQVTLAGDTHWLDPGMVDVFQPPQKITQVLVVPTILTGNPSGKLLITLAEEGERFSGNYPMPLPSQTSITAGDVNIGTISGPVSIGGNVPVLNATGTTLQTKQNQTLLGHLVAPAGSVGLQLADLALPLGTHGAMVVAVGRGLTNQKITGLKLTGSPSGYDWINEATASAPILTSSAPVGVIGSALDTTVTLTVSTAAGNTQSIDFYVIAILDTMVIELSSTSVPPPWQAPTQPPLGFAVSVANNAASTIIAGSSVAIVYLFGFFLAGDFATNSLSFRDSVTHAVLAKGLSANRAPVLWGSFEGAPLPLGSGVEVFNDSGGAVNAAGFLAWSQALA